ncbi:MAG: gamma-tubulin [Pleopsidium flavum]|nr:MAG: gamma-tubulin [Pleopsidium flavum]
MASPIRFGTKVEGSVEAPLLQRTAAFPNPTWTHARTNKYGRRLPQTIAHRGYKAKYPENTMGAFVGAVEAGAHAIETDIHLSSDDVVVLSHDATLKRCFGKKEKIINCGWNYLSTLRSLKAPHELMPRLKDLLQYLNTSGLENIWLLLDIKVSQQ